MTESIVTYPLVTVAIAKQHLNISTAAATRSDKLIRIINSVTKAVEQYCGRRFLKRVYLKEYHDGDGSTGTIFTRNCPIQSVALVAIGYEIKYAENATIDKNSSSGHTVLRDTARTEGTDYWKGGTVAVRSGTREGESQQIDSNTASGTITVSQAFSGTVASGSTYTISAHRIGTNDILKPDEYEVYPDEGMIRVAGWTARGNISAIAKGINNIRVDYQAGYTTVPDDLEIACLEIIEDVYDDDRFKQRRVTSRSISGESTTIIPVDITPRAKSILNKYRRAYK